MLARVLHVAVGLEGRPAQALDGGGARAREARFGHLGACRFQHGRAVTARERQQALALADRLLLGFLRRQDSRHHALAGGADVSRAFGEPLDVPLEIVDVVLGHVVALGRVGMRVEEPGMGRYAHVVVEDLDGGVGHAHVHDFADILEGHGVEAAPDGHVVIASNRGPLPAADLERGGRERGQRLALLCVEHAGPRPRLASELRFVDLGHLGLQRRIELREREERAVAQGGDRAPGHDAHAGFHVRLVPRLPDAGGDDRAAVVGRQVGVGSVHQQFVAGMPGHGRAAVVGHQLLGHAAEEVEGANVGGKPALAVHAEEPFRVELPRERHARDEHVDVDELAGVAVDQVHRRAGPIDLHFLARPALDVHHHAPPGRPIGVSMVERRYGTGLRPRGFARVAVLAVEKGPGHPLALELAVHPIVIGLDIVAVLAVLAGIQDAAERGVPELLRQRPFEARCLGPLDHPFDGVPVTSRRGCDLADGITQGMEPEYLPVSRHGHDRYLLP